jgi:hypothetical protein
MICLIERQTADNEWTLSERALETRNHKKLLSVYYNSQRLSIEKFNDKLNERAIGEKSDVFFRDTIIIVNPVDKIQVLTKYQSD